MTISEKDQKSFCNKFGVMMAHHVEGDKTLEERLTTIDCEAYRMKEGFKDFGVKEDNEFYQHLFNESYPLMKEAIKKFYK